ncbi:MAG TPA: formyltransferase family protein [Terriglobales bacterium]|jgi:methionyl-tRNA formyltransferase|nr:formyltransferase family protein [Terriglobales bacterium]
MRLICLVNNHLGWQALEYLRQQEQVVGVVMHPPERANFEREIRASSGSAELFTAADLMDSACLKRIAELKPDLGISVLFGYLIKPVFLSLLPQGCLNLHPAYLPYNRGAYPNVWSIVDGTPAGVTLHYIDEGVDTGDVVAQKAVPVSCTDTGEILYHKLEAAGMQLLSETWPAIQDGRIDRVPQRSGEATFHKVADVAEIDEIHLEKSYPAERLLRVLRARTFPPHRGAFFRRDGRKVYVRVQFEEEGDGDQHKR